MLATVWSVLSSFAWERNRARAEDVALRWSAPRGCPQRAEVERLLSAEVAPALGLLQVSARIERTAQGFTLDLTIAASSGPIVRRLHARDCHSLAQSAGLLVALALADRAEDSAPQGLLGAPALRTESDAGLSSGESQRDQAAGEVQSGSFGLAKEQVVTGAARSLPTGPPDRSVSESTAAQRELQQRVPRADRSSSPRPGVRYRVAGAAGLTLRALPRQAATLVGEVALELWSWSLGLRLGQGFAGKQRLSPEASLRFRSTQVALSGCGEFALGRVRVGPCAALWLQRLDVKSTGLRPGFQSEERATWLSLGLGVAARTGLGGGFEAALEAGVLLPVSERPEIDVLDLGEAAQVGPLAGYALLGCSYRFR